MTLFMIVIMFNIIVIIFNIFHCTALLSGVACVWKVKSQQDFDNFKQVILKLQPIGRQ